MHHVPDPIAPRGRLTWLLFLVAASASYLLNGLGAILALIQEELRTSRADVGVVPTLYAVGLIAVGLVGDRVVGRLDRPRMLLLAIAGTAIGAWLVATPDHGAALVGAALMGASTAFIITLSPVIIAALHPRRTIAIFGELQAANSGASVLAPFAVGIALGLGIGWRPAYLVPTLVLLAAMPFLTRIPRAHSLHARDTGTAGETGEVDPDASGPAPSGGRAATLDGTPATDRRRSFARWLDLLIAISAEFCMVFWAASAFREWHGASDDVAAALAAMFLLGMAIMRAFSSPLTRAVPEAWRLVGGSCAIAVAGFALFWAGPGLAFSAAGSLVTGLGVGMLYPVLLPVFVSGDPGAPDRASARGTLASGLAIGGAPLVLAALSDAVGLHAAYLVVPVLLGVLAGRVAVRREDITRRLPREPEAAIG